MVDNCNFEDIIKSNHSIRQCIQESVNDFLVVREEFLKELKDIGQLRVGDEMFKPLVDIITTQTLNKQVKNDRIPLAICGENSSGKTTFIHTFLQIGKIMPVNAGPVSARIVKFTYAPPAEACIRVYDSLDHKSHSIHHDLSDFFRDGNVNWSTIKLLLQPHLVRPKSTTLTVDVFERSLEFADWSRKFIEIRLPSPILKFDIDVYDTPGFLFHDAPVLKENVHNLVKLIRPTIIFMYQNPMTNDETTNGFLALKSALNGLNETNIFLLNSHVDIDKFPDISDETNENDFLLMLADERRQRYEMLLESPVVSNDMLGGLPPTLDECSSFDICAALSNDDPLGRLMNDSCIKRIIQFTVNNDLAAADRGWHLVMPAVHAYFNLQYMLRSRPTNQLIAQREEALKWLNEFDIEHRRRFEEFLSKVFSTIKARLEFDTESLAHRALSAHLKTPEQVEEHLTSLVHYEVVKRSVNEIFQSMYNIILRAPLTSVDNMMGRSNRMLCDVLCIQEGYPRSQSIGKTSATIYQTFAAKMFRSPTMFVLRVLDQDITEKEDDNDHGISESVRYLIAGKLEDRRRRKTSVRENVTTSFDLIEEAHRCLKEIKEQMDYKKAFLQDTIQAWIEHSKTKLQHNIDLQYAMAESLQPLCEQAFNLISKHNRAFVKIECQMIAAQDLAKFNGIKPTIEDKLTRAGNVFDLYDAEWGTKDSLMVKRLNYSSIIADNVYLSYLDGYYHRQLSTLAIPGVLPVLYLHQNQLSTGITELWIFFLKYPHNLSDMLQQDDCSFDLKQVLQILVQIAETFEAYHLNELVYRNLQASNIFIDDNWKEICLLDLGDHVSSIEDCHRATVELMDEDIRTFGQLGLQIISFIKDKTTIPIRLEHLMKECIDTPMNANSLRRVLESIQNNI